MAAGGPEPLPSVFEDLASASLGEETGVSVDVTLPLSLSFSSPLLLDSASESSSDEVLSLLSRWFLEIF